MVWTTPLAAADKHKSWHVFRRGGCGNCGWHCDDCPMDVATCKCKTDKEILADKRLNEENSGLTDNWRD
jgi:hypothetical protein